MSKREEIIAKVREVPAMPSTAVEVIGLVRSPDTSAGDLRRVVEHDPVLTGNVLRLANSAYFGGAGRIATLQEAIVRLGMNRVAQLAMGSAVAPLEYRAVKGYDMPPGALLRHCVSTGVAAEELAQAIGKTAPDFTFTAGLLHDLGKIVLGTFLDIDPEPIIRLAFDGGLSFEQAEQQILGIDHAETGAILLDSWNLPTSLVEIVRWHHEPDRFPGTDTLVLDLVHVADELARMSGTGAAADGLNYVQSETVLQRLGMSTHIAEEVISKTITYMKEVSDVLARTTGE